MIGCESIKLMFDWRGGCKSLGAPQQECAEVLAFGVWLVRCALETVMPLVKVNVSVASALSVGGKPRKDQRFPPKRVQSAIFEKPLAVAQVSSSLLLHSLGAASRNHLGITTLSMHREPPMIPRLSLCVERYMTRPPVVVAVVWAWFQ